MTTKTIIAIALDIDGVLNAYGDPAIGHKNRTPDMRIDPKKVELLNEAIRGFDVVFVLSSSWRIHGLESVTRDLQEAGFTGTFIGQTGGVEMRTIEEDGRGKEIRLWRNQYMEENPGTEVTLVYIDDEVGAARHAMRSGWDFIYCDGKYGFTYRDGRKLTGILEKLTGTKQPEKPFAVLDSLNMIGGSHSVAPEAEQQTIQVKVQFKRKAFKVHKPTNS
jgi:hypothetical protein